MKSFVNCMVPSASRCASSQEACSQKLEQFIMSSIFFVEMSSCTFYTLSYRSYIELDLTLCSFSICISRYAVNRHNATLTDWYEYKHARKLACALSLSNEHAMFKGTFHLYSQLDSLFRQKIVVMGHKTFYFLSYLMLLDHLSACRISCKTKNIASRLILHH